MAHFAELNFDNVVIRVVVVANAELMSNGSESEEKGIEFLASLYGHSRWKQTSYNATRRKNYAGAGFTFDENKDAFIPPRPFPSWTLNENTCRWEPPVPRPQDNRLYRWDEESLSWVI